MSVQNLSRRRVAPLHLRVLWVVSLTVSVLSLVCSAVV